MTRPIKVNLFFPITYLLMTLVITLLPMIAKPVETGIGLAMIFTSVPVYCVFLAWTSKPKWVKNLTTESSNWLQRVLMVVPQDISD